MPNIRLAIPSHINTIPFVFGLQNHHIKDEIVLSTKEYSDSILALKSNEVDVALVPVEQLHEINNHHIMSEVCISSQREMQSILLVINGDVTSLQTIYLDNNQQVANSLVRIIANGFWRCNPEYQPLTSMEKLHNLKLGEGVVLVGDVAIFNTKNLGCTIDLSSEWKKFTGLPLVVSVWVSAKPLPASFIEEFDNALRFGVSNINEAIDQMTFSKEFPKAKVRTYLSHGISYMLDHEKMVAMELFLKLQAQLQVVSAY